MNVTIPEKQKGTKKRIIIYTAIFTVCVMAIGIAVYQFFADEKLGVILGITKSQDEEIEQLKSEFNNLFTNKQNEYVYTGYEKKENSLNNYDLNVYIPYINIDNDSVKKHNEETKRLFQSVAENILQTQNRNISYSVSYASWVQDDILSVVIRSNFKEGNSAQRTIIQTYNYNLASNEEVTLDNFIKAKNIDENLAQNKIKTEIEKAQKQTEELRNLGYNIFARDITDNIYKLENTDEFFMYNGYLYLIYAYGNQNETSEMDIVIL